MANLDDFFQGKPKPLLSEEWVGIGAFVIAIFVTMNYPTSMAITFIAFGLYSLVKFIFKIKC